MDGWNTTFLLGGPIFRDYVSFRAGSWLFDKAVYQRLHSIFKFGIHTSQVLIGSNFQTVCIYKGPAGKPFEGYHLYKWWRFSKTKHLSKNNTNRKTFCWIFGALLRNSTIIRMNRMEPANRGAMLLRALAAALGSVPTILCTAAPLNANTAWWHGVCFTSVPVFKGRRMKGVKPHKQHKRSQLYRELPAVSKLCRAYKKDIDIVICSWSDVCLHDFMSRLLLPGAKSGRKNFRNP